MKSGYYWSFLIETSRFGGVMGPSCDYVTEENRESWQRFVENKIREVMKPEAMESLEFKEGVSMCKRRSGNGKNTKGGRQCILSAGTSCTAIQ